MSKRNALLFSLLTLSVHCSYAQIKPIVGFSLGLKQDAGPKNETVHFTIDEFGTDVKNRYVSNTGTTGKFTGIIHGGVLMDTPQNKIKVTGELALYLPQSRSYKGEVWEAALPDFNNFSYSYKVSSKGLMFESRLMYLNSWWFPYVLVGAGPSWNKSYAYQENPLNETAISLRGNFPSHSNTTFAYEGGAGIGIMHDKFLVSFEYKYMALGKAQFGLYPFQTMNDQFSTRLKSNQFLINVNYLI